MPTCDIYRQAFRARIEARAVKEKTAQALAASLPYLERVLEEEQQAIGEMTSTAKTRYLRGLAENSAGSTVAPTDPAAHSALRPRKSAISGAQYGALLGALMGYGSGRIGGQTGLGSIGSAAGGAMLGAPVVAYLNYLDRKKRNEKIQQALAKDEDARVFDVTHGAPGDALTGGWLNRFITY